MILTNKKTKTLLITFWLLLLFGAKHFVYGAGMEIPFAVDKSAESFSQEETLLNKRVLMLNTVLQKLLKIKNLEHVYLPSDVVLKNEKEYLELEIINHRDLKYTYRPRNEQESRFLRLHFNKDKITKIEAKIIIEDIASQKSKVLVIEDDQPLSDNKDHLIIQKLEIFNSAGVLLSRENKSEYDLSKISGSNYSKTTAKDLPITISKHGRIDFMREFYIPHLRDFIHKLKVIAGLHEPIQAQADHWMIETLKKNQKTE